jgi:hypothetical protein
MFEVSYARERYDHTPVRTLELNVAFVGDNYSERIPGSTDPGHFSGPTSANGCTAFVGTKFRKYDVTQLAALWH